MFDNASSKRNTASFINKLINERKRGGWTASMFASASAAKYLARRKVNYNEISYIVFD